MSKQVRIDEIATRILRALIKDARTSFAEIARECGISTNAVVKRFYRLKRSGVIAGTSLLLDPEEFGSQFFLSIDINIEKALESYILEKLEKIPNIFDFQPQLGKFDVHAAATAKNLEEISQIREAIKQEKGVRRVKITANLDKKVFFPENLVIEPTGVA
jgi:Lrp/AsnC family transcriptional regulator for asnA, asnC and gidA